MRKLSATQVYSSLGPILESQYALCFTCSFEPPEIERDHLTLVLAT